MTPSATAKVLDALVEDIVDRVALRLKPMVTATELVDQTNVGFNRKAYVRAARAGEFQTSKVGRLYVAKRCDVMAWLDSKRTSLGIVNNDSDVSEFRIRILEKSRGRHAP